ncbi:MAG: magnesium transporter [Candidatus Izimaplasma sp.]|nr:magnesium transporter [Candidatus Izimaplasma bacterium]
MDSNYINEINNIILEKDKDKILQFHPYEIGKALINASTDHKQLMFELMSPEEFSDIFSYLELEDKLLLMDDMRPRYIVEVIQELDIDEAVDVMLELPEEERAGYLKLMSKEHQDRIRSLFAYKEDSAGSIMTTDYIEVAVQSTVEQAMKILIKDAVLAESINTIFITDKRNTLVGTLSLKELIISRKGQQIKDLMTERVISIQASQDQEDVARIFKDYDLTELPVVDSKHRLIGLITIDDIVDVIDEEAIEDYSKFAGVSDVEFDNRRETVWSSAKKRLPWLLILSVLGFITSTIIAQYEYTLSTLPTIALFMPMILGMAGNTGTQSLAVTVRGLNDKEFSTFSDIKRHLLRELGTGILNGIIIGVIVFFVTGLFLHLTNAPHAFTITQVVSLSLMVSLTVATFSGAIIPILIDSVNIDPAVASGPFVTMLIDILALTVYFSLATILIINTL